MFKKWTVHLKNRKLGLLKILFCVGTILISCIAYFEYTSNINLVNFTSMDDKMLAQTTQKVHQDVLQFKKDNYILARNPYSSDADCRNFSIRIYEEGTFNLTALVSYPGSGNTWVRHLIETATGVYTGSVYFDEEIFARGFMGEKEQWDSGTTIVQKNHFNYGPNFDFPKAVLIIREPFSAIVAFVNYLESGHIGSAAPTTFRKREWPNYILSQTYNWISHAKSWIESGSEILVVHYEVIKQNPSVQLKRICRFLHVLCSNLDSSCYRKHAEGSFHRRKTFRALPVPKPPYPKWVSDKVDDGIDYLNKLLYQHNHETLPLKLYEHYRIPEKTNSTNKTYSQFF